MNQVDVKMVQNLFQDCHSIPKIELHAHISGSIRAETFLELAEKKGISVENLDFYNVDIKMAFQIFQACSKIVTDLQTVYRIVREIIQDYAKHNTLYLELRTTPKDFQDSTKSDYVNTVVKAIKDSEEEGNSIKTRLILSINRGMSEEQAQEIIDIAIKYKEEQNKYVVGIELSGDPRIGSFKTFIKELQRAKEQGIKLSLHCAEVTSQAVENQDMIDFHPQRLGHCCYLTKDEVKQVNDKHIPVEICPSSNVASTQSGTVGLLQHLKWFYEHKHNIIVCCDDTLLFGTNLSNELFEYAKAVGAETQDLKDLLLRNVDAIFDDSAKDWLRESIQKYRV